MSKTTQEPKEIFSVCKQNVERYFSEAEKTVPQYMQSIINLQQEYAIACRNTIESAISLQQEFATKAGINTNAPVAVVKLVNDTTDELIKIRAVQNKIILAALDTIQQNIKTFNDNVKVFSELNENILQSWISVCTPTRN